MRKLVEVGQQFAMRIPDGSSIEGKVVMSEVHPTLLRFRLQVYHEAFCKSDKLRALFLTCQSLNVRGESINLTLVYVAAIREHCHEPIEKVRI